MHRLRDEDVSTGYVFTRELRKGTDPPLFVLDLGAAPEIGRVVILHDDVPGSWLVAPADSDQPSRSLPVVGGTMAIDVLGIRAQHLHFYWSGDVPPGGLVVHEVAVFMKVGPPVVGLAPRDPWRSNRVRPTLPGLGKLPVGGNPETGLPEIDPESP